MDEFVFTAEPRTQTGSKASKRLRMEGRLPANIYGHKEENVLVSLDTKEFHRFLEAGHRILTVEVGGKHERSVVKEVQHDSLGSDLLHVDLTRVSRDERIELEVPVETVGTPKGVASGGVLEFPLQDVLVSGTSDDLPEHIELNIETLEIGQAIRIKDMPVPVGCKYMQDPELVVLHITSAREAPETPVAEAEPAEPEVIKKKEEESEDEGGKD